MINKIKKYRELLRTAKISKSAIDAFVEIQIEKLKGLISEEAALFMMCEEKGILEKAKETYKENPTYDIGMCKVFARTEAEETYKWISMENLEVRAIQTQNGKTKSGKNKGKKWSLTKITVFDGKINSYDEKEITIKISDFNGIFDDLEEHSTIKLDNVVLEVKSWEKDGQTIKFGSLSTTPNTKIEILE